MSVSLGTLMLNLELSTEAYEAQLEQARQMALNVGRDIERSLQSAGRGGLHLRPTVDDSALTRLNQHLAAKQAHFMQVQGYFNANALTPKVDTTHLDRLEKRLDNLKRKQQTSVSVSGSNPVEQSYSARVNAEADPKQLSESIKKGVSEGLKGDFIGQTLKSSLAGVGTIFSATIGSVVKGSFEQVGMSLSKSLSESLMDGLESALSGSIGSTGLIGKKIAEGLSGAISSGLETDLKDEIGNVLKDVLGETDIAIAGNATRQRQDVKQRQNLGLAREGATTQRREALRGVQQASAAVQANQEELALTEQAYQKGSRLQSILQQRRMEGGLSNAEIAELDKTLAAIATELEHLADRERDLIADQGKLLQNLKAANKRSEKAKAQVQTLQPEQQSKTYEDALRQVAGNVPEQMKPKLVVADEKLRKAGAVAQYGVESNTVQVTKELYDAIEQGQLTLDQYETLLEELNHAADFGFGQFKGVQARKNNNILRKGVKTTPEELQRLAPELALYSPEQREYERIAKTRAMRQAPKLYEKQEREILATALNENIGTGGGRYQNIVDTQIKKLKVQLAEIGAIAKKAEIDVESEIDQFIESALGVKGRTAELLQKIALVGAGQGGSEDIKQLDMMVSQELDSLRTLMEDLGGFKERVVKAATPKEVSAEVVKPGVKERLQQVAQMGSNVLHSKPVQQAANVAGTVARGVGGAAKVGYAGMKMAEDLALDAIPFGRGLKAVGQQVVIPAALMGGATMLPGVGGALGGLIHLAGGAGAAGGHMAAGGLIGQATGALSALPHALGLQATATGLATSAIEGAATGAGSLAAQGGAVVLGGRIMQVLASRAGKKALGAGVNTAKALMPASAEPLQLPMATPQKEALTVEVEAQKPMPKLKQLSASSGEMVVRGQQSIAKTDKSDKEKAIEFANKAGQAVRGVVDTSQKVAKQAQKTASDISTAANQAKNIAQSFWGAYKLLGEAVQGKDLQKAEQLLEYVKQNAERAKAEIQQTYTELKQSGASKQELSRTAGAKGNVSKSVAQAERQVQKLRKMKASEIPQDAIEVNAAKYDAWDDEMSAQRLQMPKINAEDLAVNTAGFLGSVVGGQHGMVGGLAGDLIGALLARQGINLGKAGVGAYQGLKGTEKFSQADRVKQTQMLMAEIAKRMQSQNVQKSIGNDLTGDLAGWAIGNGSAMLGNAMGLGGIPMKGAAVAMATVPQLQKLRESVAAKLSGGADDEELTAQKRLDFNPFKRSRGMSNEQKKELQDLMALLNQAIDHADTFDSAFKQANKEVEESFKASNEAIKDNLDRLANGEDTISNTDEKMGLLGKSAKFVATAFVGWQVISGVLPMLFNLAKGATEAAMEFEKFQNVINFTSGSAGKGAANLKFVTDQSKELRTDLRKSLEAYAQFSGSTQGTALEGEQTNKVFSAVNQASTVRQLDPQRQELVMTALSQMASKGVISMEELRQQLGESLPGAMNIAARSMGMTTQEFNKLVATGQLLSEDFLPKFAQQLSAESSTGLAAAANSSQASINRLNNSMYELQVGVGQGLVPLQKIGYNAIAAGLEAINKYAVVLGPALTFLGGAAIVSVIKGLMAIPGVATAVGAAFKFMQAMALDTIKTLGKFALSFAVYTAAIEVAKYLSRAFYDTSGAIGDFAKSSVANLKAFQEAIGRAKDDASEFKDIFSQVGDFLGNLPAQGGNIAKAVGGVGANIANTVVSMIPGASAIRGVKGTSGLPGVNDIVDAVANKESNDRQVALGSVLAANSQRVSETMSMLGTNGQGVAELGQLKNIDRQIEQVQMRRRNLAIANPNDKEGMRSLQAEEQGLLSQRETAAKPIALLQEGISSDLEGLKKIKKDLSDAATTATNPEDQKRYAEEIARVDSALQATQKAQDNFNTAMKGSLTTLDAFAKAFQTIVDKMEDANRGAESFYNKSRASIAEGELSGQLTSGQADVQRALANEGKISAEKNTAGDAIKQAQAELEGQNYQEILKSMGLNQNTGQSQLKTVLERVQSPKEKAVLENLIKLKDLQDNYDSLTAQAAEAKVSTRNSKQAEFMQRLDRETKNAEASFKQMQNSKQMSLIKEQTGIITKGAKNQFFSEADQALAEAGIGEKQSKLAVAAVDEQTRATQNQIDEYEKAYKAGEVSAEEYHDKVRDLTTQLSDLRVEKAKALQGVEEATARKIQATNRKLIEQSELALKRRETAIALNDTGARQDIRSNLLQSGLSEENQLKSNVAENAVDTTTAQKTIELVKFEMAENDRLRKAGAINEKTYLEKNMDLKKRLASESLRLTDLQIVREKAAQELFNKQVDIRVNKAREASAAIVRGLEAEKAGFEAVTKSLDIQAQKLQAIMGVEQARAALAQAYSDNAQAGLQNEIKGLGTQLDLMKRAKDEQDPKKKRELQKVLSATGVGYSGGEKEVLLGKQEKERALDQEKMSALETQRQLMERQFTLAQKQLEIDLKRADITAKMASLEAQIAYTKQEQTVRQAQGELEKAVRSRDPEKIRDAQINLQDQQALLAPMRDQMNLAFQGVMAQQELAGFAREKLGLEQQTQRVQSNTQMKNLQGEVSDRAVSQALEQIDTLGSVVKMPDFQQLGSESGGAIALIIPPLESLTKSLDGNTEAVDQNTTESGKQKLTGLEGIKSDLIRADDKGRLTLADPRELMRNAEKTGAKILSPDEMSSKMGEFYSVSLEKLNKGGGNSKDYLKLIADVLIDIRSFFVNNKSGIQPGGMHDLNSMVDAVLRLDAGQGAISESPVEVAAQQMATGTTFSPEEMKDSSRFMKLKPGYTMPAPAKLPTFDTSGMQFLNGYLPSDSPVIRNASTPQMAPTAGGSGGGFGDLVNVLKMFAQQVATAATSPRSLTINGSQNPTQDAANFWAQQRKMEIQEGGY